MDRRGYLRSIEAFVMNYSEFSRLRNGGAPSLYRTLSTSGSSPSASDRLAPGQFALLVDNTVLGEKPVNLVRGQLELEASL